MPDQVNTARSAEGPSKARQANTRYDDGLRRQSQRRGREKGCWLYVPAEELLKAGVDPDGPAPFYRTWGASRGGIFVRVYRER
jgi:hypothetical protein